MSGPTLENVLKGVEESIAKTEQWIYSLGKMRDCSPHADQRQIFTNNIVVHETLLASMKKYRDHLKSCLEEKTA